MLTKVEGIVIRSTDYGEGNKIITLFTRQAGKMSIMARGARKTKSRFTVAAQLFTYGEYTTFGSGNMPSLTSVDVIDSYSSLQRDLMNMSYASYIIELLSKVADERDPNPFVFECLKQTLDYIVEGRDAEIITRIFETKMLILAGSRPQMEACVVCGRAEEPYRFSVKEGGLLDATCHHRDPRSISISASSAKLLRLFQVLDLKRLGSIEVKDVTRGQLQQMLRLFMDEYLGIVLKSRDFLDQLQKYPIE
jgi:DNA repair protein RecO (recombination protein O)